MKPTPFLPSRTGPAPIETGTAEPTARQRERLPPRHLVAAFPKRLNASRPSYGGRIAVQQAVLGPNRIAPLMRARNAAVRVQDEETLVGTIARPVTGVDVDLAVREFVPVRDVRVAKGDDLDLGPILAELSKQAAGSLAKAVAG